MCLSWDADLGIRFRLGAGVYYKQAMYVIRNQFLTLAPGVCCLSFFLYFAANGARRDTDRKKIGNLFHTILEKYL